MSGDAGEDAHVPSQRFALALNGRAFAEWWDNPILKRLSGSVRVPACAMPQGVTVGEPRLWVWMGTRAGTPTFPVSALRWLLMAGCFCRFFRVIGLTRERW